MSLSYKTTSNSIGNKTKSNSISNKTTAIVAGCALVSIGLICYKGRREFVARANREVKSIINEITDERRTRYWIGEFEVIYGGDRVGYIIYASNTGKIMRNNFTVTSNGDNEDTTPTYYLYAVKYRTETYAAHCHCSRIIFGCCHVFERQVRYEQMIYSSKKLGDIVYKYVCKMML